MRGSIRQHGKGWQIRYWYTDATGRRRQRGETAPTSRLRKKGKAYRRGGWSVK